MIWARMLAYINGTVDEELLLRNEYLAAENRACAKIKGRLLLSESEKVTQAGIVHRPGRRALADVAAAANGIPCSAGIESSSPRSLADRDFVSPWAALPWTRKRSAWSCDWP